MQHLNSPPANMRAWNPLSPSSKSPITTLLLILLLLFLIETLLPSLLPQNCHPLPLHNETDLPLPHLPSTNRMLQITSDGDFVYFPSVDIVMITMAKGGSTSMFNFFYTGLTGHNYFNMSFCNTTYVQDISSHCWRTRASNVRDLSVDEQRRVLTSRETLRVAIQRDPYDRLVSSWKSKFTCDAATYQTDVHNRVKMVPALLAQAGMPASARADCLSIAEFAQALDAVRRRVRAGDAGWLTSLRKMDVHLKPQDFFWAEIDWDIILDVAELTEGASHLDPVIQRLPYRELVADGPPHKHRSTGDGLLIPELAARQLHSFALESKTGKSKYLV